MAAGRFISLEGGEGVALRLADVRVALEDRDVPHVGVERGDVPVAHEGQGLVGAGGEPALGLVGQLGEPVELVVVVRVVQLAAVGHVEAPEADALDGDADRARLLGLVGPLGPLGEAGLGGERDLDVLHRQPAREGHAVPLAEAVQFDLVAGVAERVVRELLRLALDLLEAHDVDVLTDEPVDDAPDAGSDGVDVVGRDAHDHHGTGPTLVTIRPAVYPSQHFRCP